MYLHLSSTPLIRIPRALGEKANIGIANSTRSIRDVATGVGAYSAAASDLAKFSADYTNHSVIFNGSNIAIVLVLADSLAFNPNGGTPQPPSIIVMRDSTIKTLPTVERQGYTFKGWTIDGDTIKENSTWTYTENKTAVAQWEANRYTISFDLNNGNGESPDQFIVYDTRIDSLPTVDKPGFNFAGWAIDGIIITESTIWNFPSNKTAVAQWEAICPESMVLIDTVNGDEYPVIPLVGLCWMRENFKGIQYADGTPIPFANGYDFEGVNTVEENIDTYGRLYNWASASQAPNSNPQGACPTGWRLPTTEEMTQLGEDYSAEELRSSNFWNNMLGYNNSGFNAFPAGIYNATLSRYEKLNAYTAFWTYSSTSVNEVQCAQLKPYCSYLEIVTISGENAISIRCVKE